jgi:hypothetical protein
MGTGCFEHGNGYSDSIRGGVFLDQLNVSFWRKTLLHEVKLRFRYFWHVLLRKYTKVEKISTIHCLCQQYILNVMCVYIYSSNKLASNYIEQTFILHNLVYTTNT